MIGLSQVRKILFVGDTVPNSSVAFGQSLKKLCAEHNVRVFNLEGAFSGLREPLFKAGPHLLLELNFFEPIAECFNVATLANNHVMDFGLEGLDTTILQCKRVGIATVGAGLNLDEAFAPLDIGNCRIISVAENEFGAAGKDKAGIATVDRPIEIYSLIKKGREAGKFVAVVAHGGTECIPIPPPYLRQRYKLWIEYGADLIVGNHPHVVQGFELYKNKPIFYSLGNFAFFNNDSFRDYANAHWSIAVSVDIPNNKIQTIPVRSDGNNIVDIDGSGRYEEEFSRLCSLIQSGNYSALYNQIAAEVYESWYPRLSTTSREDAALLLHYLRCDAHRNLVQTALSQKIGEPQSCEQTSLPVKELKSMINQSAEKQENRKTGENENNFNNIKIRPGSMDKDIVEEMKRDIYHVSNYVRDNDFVLDVGAYNGSFALYVKKICPKANVICIEPMPDNFSALQENVGDLAKLEQVALVGKPGPVIIYDFGLDANACHSIYNLGVDDAVPVQVKGETLQNIMQRYEIEHLRFVKLDCQGAEFEVISNTPHDVLAKIDYVAMEVHTSIAKKDAVIGSIPDSIKKRRLLYQHLLKTHIPVHGDIEKDSIQVWAHRNLVQTALSQKIGETQITNTNDFVLNNNSRKSVIKHLEKPEIDLGDEDENWFTHEESFSNLLAKFKGQENLRFLELGSWKGRSALWLANNILTGQNSKVICVDVWDIDQWNKRSEETIALLNNPKRMRELKVENLYEMFLRNTEHLRDKIIPKRKKTADALREFIEAGEKFDFIYIDADHSEQSVYEDFYLSCRCINPSGIIFLDDLTWDSVRKAVKRIRKNLNVKIVKAGSNGAYYINEIKRESDLASCDVSGSKTLSEEDGKNTYTSDSSYPVTIKTMDERVLDVPQLPTGNSSGTLNKIIGFCITKKDINFDFAFKKHFPWLSFEKLRVGSWFVHLWGHGSFAPFIRQDNTTAIIAGYTQQELEMLGTERLENRGVFIRVYQDTVEVENDMIGSFQVFYGRGRDNVCISSVEDLVLQNIGRQPIDKTNLIQYLLLGHLTGEQTVYPHIFTMKANSLLHCNGMGFETQPLAPLHFRNSKNPVDDLYMITVSTIRRYTDGYEKFFLPLSGGYDSRMLAACVEQPERITARTYDYAYPIEFGYEVSRARAVTEAAGIEDWDWCDLGSDFTADYGRRWFDIFGTSHHLHGMYALAFYDKVFSGGGVPIPVLSGYIGDVFVGHQLHAFEQVRNTNLVTKFWKSQFVDVEGFQIEELKSLLNYDVDALLQVVFKRWQQLWQECEGQEYQKFILNFVRNRARTHISYLCTLADIYGAAITPFTDRKYIETVLGLPYKFLLNREAQEQVFQKYFPSFWLDESELPEYKHCMNFLCMHKRGLDNIFPIVSDDSVRSYSLFRPEAVKQWVQEFTERCNSKKLIYSHKIIRSLYRLNTLQPLFYADYLKGTESECAKLGRKRDLISCHKESETGCVGVKVSVFSAQEFFRKGVIQLRSGNNTEALDYFNQARSLCSNMPEVHFALATAYAQLGDVYSAKKACEMELLLQPGNEGAKRLLGRIEKVLNESVSICEPNMYMVSGTTNLNIFGIRSEIEKHRLPGTEQPVPESPRQHHVEKNADNLKLQMIGTEYGGWTVDLDLIPYGSTVISAGVGEDISFDLGLINLKNCNVIGIDPTEKARRYIENNKNEHIDFIQKALYSESNKKIKIYKSSNPDWVSESLTPSHHTVTPSQFYEAETISVQDLLNNYKNVSVLKMDIEGAEYEVLNSISKLDIPQICVEFHHFCTDFTSDDTEKCIKHLQRMGYVLAHSTSGCGAVKEATFVHQKYVSTKTTETNICESKTYLKKDIPVVLVCYNRPKHTLEVLKALKEHNIKNIYIFSDAAKSHEDTEAVSLTRRLVHSIDWTKPKIIERTENLGLARNIVSAVDYVFEQYDRLILLEDDCVPQRYFFDFMHTCLKKYENNQRVFGISGYTVKIPDHILVDYPYDLYFCPRIGSWGWATWKRAWQHYEKDLRKLVKIANERNADLTQGGTDIPISIEKFLKGQLKDVWTLNWVLSVYINGGVYIYPTRSHIRNIGMDSTGLHCGKTDKYDSPCSDIRPTRYPEDVFLDERIMENFKNYYQSTAERSRKAINFLKSLQREKPLKIAQISTVDRKGGAARVAWMLKEGLKASGLQTKMFVKERFSEDSDVQRITNPVIDGGDDYRSKGFLYYDINSTFLLSRNNDFISSDIFHFHNLHGDYFNPFALPELTKIGPSVWTLHDMQSMTGHCAYAIDCEKWQTGCGNCPYPEAYPPITKDRTAEMWRDKKLIYKESDFELIVPSQWLKNIVEKSILKDKKVHLIYNGIDERIYRPWDKHAIRKMFSIPPNAVIISFVAHGGLNDKRKGGNFILEAYKYFTAKYPNAFFICVGGTSDKAPTERFLQIPFLLDEEKLVQLYCASDIFLFPTLVDNCPLVILEVMGCSVPIVSFNTGGVPELIEHGKTGLIAELKNSEEFIKMTEHLIANRAKREEFGAAGRERLLKMFTLEQMIDKHIALYERLAEQGKKKNYVLPKNKVAMSAAAGEKQYKYLVSAIVSTYNSEKHIRGCLEDLENQTIADRLEIVVVNSGSQQNEEAIVKEFQKKYNNIKYIKTERRETIYKAWNRAIKAASGEYITNANTDDRRRQDALEIMAKALDENPNKVLVYANCTEVKELNGQRVPVGEYIAEEFSRARLFQGKCPPASQPMWRREAHDVCGYFDEGFGISGDYEFWFRLTQKFDFLYLNDTLGERFLGTEAVCRTDDDFLNWENMVVRKCYEYAQQEAMTVGATGISKHPVFSTWPEVNIWKQRAKAKLSGKQMSRTDYIKNAWDYRTNPTPKLTVVIVAYDRRTELLENLNALNDQTDKDFEVIVVDNSGDLAELKNCADEFNYGLCGVELNLNLGPSLARNIGTEFAKAGYIAFLDDDAVADKHLVRNIVEHFENHRISGLRGKVLPKTQTDLQNIPVNYDLGDQIITTACEVSSLSAFRKDVLVKMGGFDELLFGSEGMELSYRICKAQKEKVKSILYFPDVIVYHDHRPKGPAQTEKILRKQWMEILALRKDNYILGYRELVRSLYPRRKAIFEDNYKNYTWIIDVALSLRENFPEETVEWAEKAVALRPDGFKGCYVLGSLYTSFGRYDEAIVLLEKIFEPLRNLAMSGGSEFISSEFKDQADMRECYLGVCEKLAQCYTQTNQYHKLKQLYTDLLNNPNLTIPLEQKAKIRVLLTTELQDVPLPAPKAKIASVSPNQQIDEQLQQHQTIKAAAQHKLNSTDTAKSRQLPIVFVNFGNQDGLKYALAQAKLSNPNAVIYLIGDETNDKYDFVEHHHYKNYFTAAQDFANVYKHLSTNKYNAELVCFLRWFILREFLEHMGFGKCLYLDSDVMIYTDVQQYQRKYKDYDFTLSLGQGPGCNFINSVSALTEFCDLVIQHYTNPVLLKNLEDLFKALSAKGLPGGVSDMLLFGKYREKHPDKVCEASQIEDHSKFDHHLNVSENFEMQNGFKKVIWIKNQPYGKHVDYDKPIKFNTLHFQGKASGSIKDYFTGRLLFATDKDKWVIESFTESPIPTSAKRKLEQSKPRPVCSENRYLVSAIVSTYNSERFLRGCLDDLERQTIADKLEIIVVNSGSQQNEEAIVKEFQKKYNNIKYIKTEQRETIYKAWNRAIKAASGEYITNANTDDRHSKDALEIMASTLQANLDVALVYGDQIRTETPNDTFENHHGIQMDRRPEYSRDRLLFGCCVGSQPMWRKSLHNELGYFDESLACSADWDFWLRVSSKYKFKHITEFLGLYYYNREGIEHGRRIHSWYERYMVGRRYGTEYIRIFHIYEHKNNPLVSIIMPVYNMAGYVAEAIESVLIQNYMNFELIVVDDGSTDRTRDVVLKFKDPRVKYFYKENGGPYSARNLGTKKATGDFIVPLDADDMITPDYIASHLQEFERCPDADLIYCDDCLIEEDCKPIRVIERREYTDRKLLIRDLFRCGFPIVPFRTCIRKSVFDRIGLFDDGFRNAMDYDMIRRFVKHGLKAHHLKAPLYLRRMTPDSVSRKVSDEKVRAHFEVLRRFTESFSYDELFPDVAWDKIAPEGRQLHAKCLAAMTYLAIGKTYVKKNLPIYGKMAFGQACSELNDCLKMDPGNPQIRQLLQKCEFGRQKYDEQLQQHQNIAADTLSRSVGLNRTVQMCPTATSVSCGTKEDDEYLVTAIVSTYNSEKFLRGCLDDLEHQTIADKLEIIVVNSGSKQNEDAIVPQYQRKHNNIVYIKTEHREGIYAAWNRAVKAARGKFITNANTDDRHSKDALEIMVSTLQANLDVALVYGDQIRTETPNDTFENHHGTQMDRRPEYSRDRLLFGCCVGSQPMWRKSLHNEFGYFDDTLTCAADWDFWLRISSKYKFKHIPEFLGLYYYNEDGIEHGKKIHSLYERYIVGKRYGNPYISVIPLYQSKDNPLVSVIMPAYNAAEYIAEAIESVLIQNYRNFELIVVDDGSTDNTKDIIAGFKDDKIKYFYKENAGPASARNLGIKKAASDFIVPLDADDMITPDCIARHLQEFERCPDADFIYCDDYWIDVDCKPIQVFERREYTDRKSLIRDLFRGGFPVVPFRTCIRRGVFDKIGFYDDGLSVGEDYDMMRRFVKHGLKAHHIKAPLYLRRMAPDSISRKVSDEKVRAHFEVLRRFTESFSYDELFPDVAWDKIAPESRQLHAKCLAAVTYLAIGQTFIKTHSPVYGKMAFGQACSELRDSLKMDPGNPQIRQLLQKCEFGRQKYDEQILQAVR